MLSANFNHQKDRKIFAGRRGTRELRYENNLKICMKIPLKLD